MTMHRRSLTLAAIGFLLLAGASLAHDPSFTSDFDRERCTFTTTGSNPYFPLWPGYALLLEGEDEDDEGELVEVSAQMTVLPDTEIVDGVLTRVFEERESEDGELVEVSRNFMAVCRETGDVWYFGEDVDDYEDGVIIGHEGGWRAGVNGARPGIIMLGNPILGARYQEESAPGVAEDRAEIVSLGEEVVVPAGTFDQTVGTLGSNPLNPDEQDEKFYARGVGNIVDEALQLVEITPPPCQPDATTLCLNDGRFKVTAEWEVSGGDSGQAQASFSSDDGGQFWFFSPNNPELLVKVLDACTVFHSFWVFAGGLTNVGVTLTVEDTQSGETKVYENPVGTNFAPILDTAAFPCP